MLQKGHVAFLNDNKTASADKERAHSKKKEVAGGG